MRKEIDELMEIIIAVSVFLLAPIIITLIAIISPFMSDDKGEK